MIVQYRVAWQREGSPTIAKSYGNNRARAESMVLFLQGHPEEATGHKRTDLVCCDGWECACRGQTWGERWDARMEELGDLPPLVFARVETRTVERWRPA